MNFGFVIADFGLAFGNPKSEIQNPKSQMPKPTAITLDRSNKLLLITWDDGQTCRYPLQVLREACPCVECRGGHANMGKKPEAENLLGLSGPGDSLLIPLTRTKSYEVTRLTPVGKYALMPEWADGHKAGIYTWSYLRDLCAELEDALKRRADSPSKP
ncbi:MAG: DUF971 domain-containing protein [Oscillochloridaceae bacterium]|nr:DUF971 domain-containing protein [Oscillochloridaceae bacterium]